MTQSWEDPKLVEKYSNTDYRECPFDGREVPLCDLCQMKKDPKEECEHGKEVGKTCARCGGLCFALPKPIEPKEGWEDVFGKMHNNDSSTGSSGWYVSPSTVKIFIKGLLREENSSAERELLDNHLKKLEDWMESLRAILDK